MKKLTWSSMIFAVLLTAGAGLIATRAACHKHGIKNRLQTLAGRMDSTYCEEHVFPMVVRDLRRTAFLNVYRREDESTQGDTLRGGGLFRPELGMRITIYMGVNCWIDLSNFSLQDISAVYRDGVPTEIILLLPRPTLSPVEIIHIHEYPLHIRRMDNAGAEIALLRESLINTAKANFLDESIRYNILGRAKQNAEDRIRALVEPILASEGLHVTVRLEFGSPGTDFSENRN